MADFKYQPLFESHADHTQYRKLNLPAPQVEEWKGKRFLKVDPQSLVFLCEEAFDDVSHLLRTSHLEKLAAILKDPEASSNDRFVAIELLKNAVIAAERVFPSCQDTGTALVLAKKGEQVLTESD
ncbi:MAG: fumarate hydratase, partial [Proteobacteria bacterium]|nr:fumarate hydratase [Pseudomonadota bacterium]